MIEGSWGNETRMCPNGDLKVKLFPSNKLGLGLDFGVLNLGIKHVPFCVFDLVAPFKI